VTGNRVQTPATADAVGIKIFQGGAPGSLNAYDPQNIAVVGNSITHNGATENGYGIWFKRGADSTARSQVRRLLVCNNVINNVEFGIQTQIVADTFVTQYFQSKICGNIITAKTTGILIRTLGFETSDVSNNIIHGVSDRALEVSGCIKMNIQGNKVYDSGIAYDFEDCEGTLWGNQAFNCTTVLESTPGEDLGAVVPTWTTDVEFGTLVQAMIPASAGTIGWVFTSTGWKAWGTIA